MSKYMEVIDKFSSLQREVQQKFIDINKNPNVKLYFLSNGKGIYIIFGKLAIRSSIRIYPSNNPDIFSYAIGNKQFDINSEEIINRFTKDYQEIIQNFENNVSSAPIEELIKFTNDRKINQNELPQDLESQLLNLPHEHFIEELRILSNSVIENKKLEENLRKERKEKQLNYYINSFINKAEIIFRKEAIKKAKEGKKIIKLSMNNLINNNYLLKEFNTEEINKVLDQEFINDRLKKIFKGLNFSINQVNQSYRPYDLILTLEW